MLPYLLVIFSCLYLISCCLVYIFDCEAYEDKGGEVYIPLTFGNILHYLAWPYHMAKEALEQCQD